MKIIMLLNGNEIDSIPLPTETPLTNHKITKAKVELEERNEEILDLTDEEPQFALEGVPSRLNFFDVIEQVNAKKRFKD